MDKVLQLISEHLKPGVKIELYSSHNRHLLDSTNIILWDQTSASINPDVYKKLQIALHSRVCGWYKLSKKVPYHDFCIALLCSVSYTLNHTTISQVESRTFKSAWRTISVMIGTADKDLQEWIKDRIQDRDAGKYLSAMGLDVIESPITERRVSSAKYISKFTLDEDIISKACSSKNIREITCQNNPGLSVVINKVVSTPECQLDNLRTIHSELIGGHL